MDTVTTSQAVKACGDELHKYYEKMLMPDCEYASLVAGLARGAKKHCRNHGESTEIAELVHDEIYGRGLDRWLETVQKAAPTASLNQADFESAVMEFDYMFRNGRAKPQPAWKKIVKKNAAQGSKLIEGER